MCRWYFFAEWLVQILKSQLYAHIWHSTICVSSLLKICTSHSAKIPAARDGTNGILKSQLNARIWHGTSCEFSLLRSFYLFCFQIAAEQVEFLTSQLVTWFPLRLRNSQRSTVIVDRWLFIVYAAEQVQLLTSQLDTRFPMGWLRLVGSLKLQVSFAAYRLFYRALLQKTPVMLRSLLIEATPYPQWQRTFENFYLLVASRRMLGPRVPGPNAHTFRAVSISILFASETCANRSCLSLMPASTDLRIFKGLSGE